MKLDNSLLCYFIRDSLTGYSDDFRMLDWDNPVRFSLNGIVHSVHVSYVHDSGNHRENEDEARKQMQRPSIDTQQKRFDNGDAVAFIGVFPESGIFVGWDPRQVFSLTSKTNVSVYCRKSQEAETKSYFAAAHIFPSKTLNEESMAVSLQSSVLGFYLENTGRFHSVRDEKELRRIVRGYEANDTHELESGREKFIHTRTSYPRSPDFSRNVLSAYNYSCAVCGRQMGIVQAVHIIPHAEENSTDDVRNGIALCVEHHELYDTGLLLPGPGGRLVFNETREKYLRAAERANGIDDVRQYENKEFALPENTEHQPSDEFLRRGLEIRCPR